MIVSAHLPALQVIIPLIAAPICSLLPRSRMAWIFTSLISVITFCVSIGIVLQVNANGAISYNMGNWPAPWGISYHIDSLSSLMLVLISSIASITIIGSRTLQEQEISPHKRSLFYSAFLLCMTGLLGIAATGDAFNVFVFLEISSLSAYALIASGRDRKALMAAYQYLIMGTIGATFILIGIGLLYMQTGTLNMLDLHDRIPAISGFRSIHAAFAFFTVGIFLKLALFPLHQWLPNAYTYAPSSVSIFLAATATKVALYLLYRIFFTVFGFEFSFDVLHLSQILIPLSVVAVIISSLVAIFQTDVKRLLAYSSLGQIAYMTLGISLQTQAGLVASIVHLFNHAFIKGALFMCLACLASSIKTTKCQDLAGIGRTHPWVCAAFVIGGIALIGIPPTSGFISKWYLVAAILDTSSWWLVIIVMFTSLLTVVYIWRVVEQMYFRGLAITEVDITPTPRLLMASTWLMIFLTIYFGIDNRFPVHAAQSAVESLL